MEGVREQGAKETPKPKRKEVTGGWRKLHNEELHNSNASPYIREIITRSMRWARHIARMEETRNTHKILVGKSERKVKLGRYSCKCWIILEWILGK
jgi:hypothetical protein